MNRKKNLVSILALVVAVICFSLSVFNFQDSLFIAAWIAPFAMMRFTRGTKWWIAVVVGFIALQLSSFLGTLPFIGTAQEGVGMTFGEVLYMRFRLGLLFHVPNALIPFLLDKAFYKRLPALAGSLIYPLSVLVIELIVMLLTGGMITTGETQFHLQPILGLTSLIGVLGVGFIISWFAPVMNLLWEKKGAWREMKGLKLVYPLIMAGLIIYGSVYVTYTKKSSGIVKIAGITGDAKIFEKMGKTDYTLNDFVTISSDEFKDIISTTEEDLNLLRTKNRNAIKAGAEIIIWQEFAFHAGSKEADLIVEEMRNEAKKTGVYILVSYGEVLSDDKREKLPLRNRSVLVTPEGEIAIDYGKTKVNPGYEDVIYEAGDGNIPYVDTPFGRVGVIICADALYQHFIKQVYDKDIDLLLVPGWDSTTSTPKIIDCSDIRTVEFGYTSVRVAGDGLSTVTDPYFRRWAQQNSFEPSDEELYTENFYANVPIISKKTFFGSVGYWLQWLSLLILPALIIWALLGHKKEVD